MYWDIEGILFGLFLLAVVGLLGLVGFAAHQDSKEEQLREKACYAAKGEWYKSYRSKGVCLKPGSVINP